MKNTKAHYGWVSIFFHWSVAIIFFVLFTLGWWMVELGYYDVWYKTAPALHKSIGLCLMALMIIRLLWRVIQIQPEKLASHSNVASKAAKLTHFALYLVVFSIMISGYLISTADGRSIEVFQWFEIPALAALIDNQEDIAGLVHQWLAYIAMALVLLHAIAALKHHFIDKDDTLTRMLGKRLAKNQ